MIKWIIYLCGKLSLNSTDNTTSEHSSVKPVAKRQRIEQMFFGYSRMNIGAIIDKAEQNQLCQTLLSLLKLFVGNSLSLNSGMDIVNSLKIPYSISDNIQSVNDVLENLIDHRYNDLIWVCSVCYH
jgi:hypothetical protein